MLRTSHKYWAIFRAQILNRLAYPGDLLTQAFSIVLFMFVFMQLWRATYGASGQSVIAGFSLSQTIWYLMMAETIMLSRPRLSRRISDDVKDGAVAYLLNKPYNFLLYQFSVSLGDSLSGFFFYLTLGGATAWLMVGPPPGWLGFLLMPPVIILAWILDGCFSALIGLAAFISEENAPFEWIYNKALMILGGLLIPLDFFPDWLRSISQVLPFAFSIYGPARLFVQPSPQHLLWLLSGQLAWLTVMVLLLTWIYRGVVQRLVINGG